MFYKTRAVALLTLFILFSGCKGLENGEQCRGRNNVPGTCKLIYECAQAIKDIKAGVGRVLCKTGQIIELVCCANPISIQPAAATTPVDLSRLRMADRKCHEYSEYVYETEVFPVLLPGGKPITKQVDKCGFKVVPLIVGGVAAGAKEFPHMARLGYGAKSSIFWGCGGTIISRRYILTAGHCVVTSRGEPTFARIGDLHFTRTDDDADPKTIRVTQSIPNPNYKAPQQYHDIALVLTDEMQFNQYVRPACLNTQLNIPQTKAIASGWGDTEFAGDSSDALLKVTLELFRFNQCQSLYETNRKLSQGLLDNQQMCAGSHTEEKDTCSGDSGGPLQVYHDLHCMYRIIGVTSFGKGCGTAGLPGVYARVSNYVDWIENIAFSYG